MGSVIKAVNKAYDRMETRPFWKVRLHLDRARHRLRLVTAGMLLLIVFGGPLGDAISHKAHLGGAFLWVWTIARWPIAFGSCCCSSGSSTTSRRTRSSGAGSG